MSCVLGVLSQPETEVEANLDQVGDIAGFGFSGGCRCSRIGLDDAKGGGLLFLYKFFLNAVVFKLNGEAPFQSGVVLGIWDFYAVGKATRR